MTRRVDLRSPQGTRVTLLGGIVGVASDQERLRQTLLGGAFDAVLLGVPFEDLDAVRATDGAEATKEFEQDETSELYFERVRRFEPVVIPPPDLYEAFRHATAHQLPVEAIDLGDEAHTEVFARHVGMFEVLRNNRALRRLAAREFRSGDLDAFVIAWDAALYPSKGLRRVQQEREAWMAQRIQQSCASRRAVFALVPLARLAGVRRALENPYGFTHDSPTGNG